MISVPNLERQHRGNLNLHYTAQNLLAKIKTSVDGKRVIPVAFADEGMVPQHLQYLQFMADCDWYGIDAFNVRFAGGFGFAKLAQAGQRDPNGAVTIQNSRIDFLTKFFKGKSANDLVKEQNRVMDAAFAERRPVYALLKPGERSDFRRRFLGDHYEMKELDHWSEPCSIRFPDESYGPDGQPREHVSPLGLGRWAITPIINWMPEEYYLVEIVAKARAKPATTQPVTPTAYGG